MDIPPSGFGGDRVMDIWTEVGIYSIPIAKVWG